MNLRVIYLVRQQDGSYIDWGRWGPGREGGASHYTGEHARILDLVLKHSRRPGVDRG